MKDFWGDNYLKDLSKFSIDPKHLQMEEIELPEYEDTLLKQLANDIAATQEETTKKLDDFIQESRESSALALKIAIIALFVAILTLIATIIGILV